MKKARNQSHEHYLALYQQWKDSDMPVSIFCTQASIKYSTFRYWAKKFESTSPVAAGFTEIKMDHPCGLPCRRSHRPGTLRYRHDSVAPRVARSGLAQSPVVVRCCRYHLPAGTSSMGKRWTCAVGFIRWQAWFKMVCSRTPYRAMSSCSSASGATSCACFSGMAMDTPCTSSAWKLALSNVPPEENC